MNDAEQELVLQTENRTFFERFAMSGQEDFYTLEGRKKRIEQSLKNAENDTEYNFFCIFLQDQTLIGTISLFQVVRGAIQSAFIGYFSDGEHNGKGYATKAVKLAVDYAFNELKLHRIEAGVMPHNKASIRVLEKAGFHKEDIARKNVKINGKWEDHQVLAIIHPEDK
ncbi:GNAT family N-acetyltransferase [Bacillus velezensis]|nr:MULTISPECIES: GNAT family protein [Bacillus amyloliquefaciens group]UYP24785.1 GNAT family N-acetyltransferase [Bacillus velezensis]